MAEQDRQPDPPLYNSRLLSTYLKLIKERYRHVNVNDLLSSVNIERHQVDDEGHWFTQKQMNRFHERLNEVCGSMNIARETGVYTASASNLGSMRRHLFSLARPSTLYKTVGRLSEKLTRSARFEVTPINNTTVEIIVTPYPGIKEEPYQCQNRQGFFEAIPLLYNAPLPKITHDECVFNGDSRCRYVVNWAMSPASLWKKIRNISVPLLLLLAGLSLMLENNILPAEIAVPGSLILLLMIGWFSETMFTRELHSALQQLQKDSFEDLNRINESYNNSLLINEIGENLGSATETDEVLTEIVDVIQKRLDYDRGIILLPNLEHTRLVHRAGYGYTEELLSAFISETGFHLDRPESKGIFIVCFREQKSFLINDSNKIKDDLSSRSREFLEKSGASSFICCPITCENESLGILAVDNIKTKRPLLQSDLNLLQGVAAQIGISIYNVRLKNKLTQSQKMESIGRLAGGVAHDFNNILSTVMSYSSMGLQKISAEHVLHGYLQSIIKACEKAENLTKQLLIFSRGQALQTRTVDLNQVVGELTSMLTKMVGDKVTLNLNIETSLQTIQADPGQLEQILMNFAVNARDAMPAGGIFSIETMNEEITNGHDLGHLMIQPGQYVRITISDTGNGMPANVQKKVFEPFFTTKEGGKNTGLGLATVYGIIKQHKGYIHLESEVGQGTTFNIYLPVASS